MARTYIFYKKKEQNIFYLHFTKETIMRKIFFPALLLVAAMSSCSQNDVDMASLKSSGDSSDKVTANIVSAGSISRGAVVTTSTLEDSDSGVDIYIKDAKDIDSHYNFKATDSDWSQSNSSLLWNDITFPAYFFSMHDGEAQFLSYANGKVTLSYTVSGASTAHKDLVYHASTLSAIPSSAAVNAYHQHALSRLSIYAGTGGNKVYIAKVTVMNLDGEGIATIDPDGIVWTMNEINSYDYEYYPINDEEVVPIKLQSTTVDNVTTNPLINDGEDASLMIIPQTAVKATVPGAEAGGSSTVTDVYIEVIYYLTDSDDNALVGYSAVSKMSNSTDYIDGDQEKTLYVKAAFPLGKTFVDNMHYYITLGLGMVGSTGGYLVDDFYVDEDGDPVKLTTKEDANDGDDGDDDSKKVDIPDLLPGDEIFGGSYDLVDIIVDMSTWGSSESLSI